VPLTSSPGILGGSGRHCGSIPRLLGFGSTDRVSPPSPGTAYCFNSTEEDAGFWQYTPMSGINETISGKFNERDSQELYSQVDLTEQKVKDFGAHCQNGSIGPYLKYVGTSSTVRDLVSLGDAILGEGEPINYWGISYGTILGFNFINSKFPKPFDHNIRLKPSSSVPRGRVNFSQTPSTPLNVCSVSEA